MATACLTSNPNCVSQKPQRRARALQLNENQRGESRVSFVRSVLIRDRARLRRRRAKRDRGAARTFQLNVKSPLLISGQFPAMEGHRGCKTGISIKTPADLGHEVPDRLMDDMPTIHSRHRQTPLPSGRALISFGFPFGLSAVLPVNVPLPTKIVMRVLEPIDIRAEFGDDPDIDAVDSYVRGVCGARSTTSPPDAGSR